MKWLRKKWDRFLQLKTDPFHNILIAFGVLILAVLSFGLYAILDWSIWGDLNFNYSIRSLCISQIPIFILLIQNIKRTAKENKETWESAYTSAFLLLAVLLFFMVGMFVKEEFFK